MSAVAYIERVALRLGLDSGLDTRTNGSRFCGSESNFVEEPTEQMVTPYRSLIGNTGYSAVTVRFDTLYTCSLDTSVGNSRLIAAANRNVKYSVHTKDLGITWSVSEQDKESGFANVLFAVADASFAMCRLTNRSHFRYTTFLNHGLVS